MLWLIKDSKRGLTKTALRNPGSKPWMALQNFHFVKILCGTVCWGSERSPRDCPAVENGQGRPFSTRKQEASRDFREKSRLVALFETQIILLLSRLVKSLRQQPEEQRCSKGLAGACELQNKTWARLVLLFFRHLPESQSVTIL
jgi:hypothetical protein